MYDINVIKLMYDLFRYAARNLGLADNVMT